MDSVMWYWEQYGITKETLALYGVEFALEVYIGDFTWDISEPDNPIFVYNFPSGRKKFYKPLTKNRKRKFWGSATVDDINGWDQLALYKGGPVFITKSLKDVMVLHEMGYNAIAPQGEQQMLLDQTVDYLKETYGEVVVFFDNDGVFHPPDLTVPGKGKEATKKYVNKFEIPYLLLPSSTGAKDISDFVVTMGGIEYAADLFLVGILESYIRYDIPEND